VYFNLGRLFTGHTRPNFVIGSWEHLVGNVWVIYIWLVEYSKNLLRVSRDNSKFWFTIVEITAIEFWVCSSLFSGFSTKFRGAWAWAEYWHLIPMMCSHQGRSGGNRIDWISESHWDLPACTRTILGVILIRQRIILSR
jgi:hypothetical protein